MRTTVTLDADAEAILRRLMTTRGVSFKQALNDSIRSGSPAKPPRFTTRVHHMGKPAVNLDHALQLAAEMEDEELIRRMQVGK